MSVAGGLARIKDALGQREFGIYVAGNSVSLVGTWMQRTTTGWLAWDLTGQSFWVGMVVLADLIPGLVIGPFGGVLADRVDRRHILLVTQSGLALLSATMAGLAALGLLGLAPLLLLVGLHGCLIGLNQPARLALIPALVAPTQLPTAIAVNSIVFNSARFVGPALAGALLVTAGPAAPLAGNALSYLAFIAALLVMRPASAPPAGRHGRILAEIAEGVRFVAAHPAIGPLFLLFIASSILVRPLGELLPGLADTAFGGGAASLATLSSSVGLGAIGAGFYAAQAEPAAQVRRALLATLASVAGAVALALAPALWIACIAAAAYGAALLLAGVTAQTVMQLATPAALRGRVMSLFGITFRGAPALGAVVLGAVGDAVGIRAALALAALGLVPLWLAVWRGRARYEAALRAPAVPSPPD